MINHTIIHTKRIIAALLSVLFFVMSFFIMSPRVYAADEPLPEETVFPSEPPLPSEDSAVPSDEPVPTPDTPQTADAESIITEADGTRYASDEVIVKFKKTVSDSAAAATLTAQDSDIRQDIDGNAVVADVPQGETVDSFIDTLQDQPGVEFAQPNFMYQISATVNDPGASSQWYLNSIGAPNAWDITMGTSDVRVAVLDTGIDLTHPEFSGQIFAQADTVTDDGNAQDDSGDYSCYGHGTHVAGIIAAKANNLTGISGVAPGVRLIPVDVFDGNGAWTNDIVEGIQFAVANGADVINMSFGGYGTDSYMEWAINNAVSAGVVCVAAAGNDNTDSYFHPSDYDSVISVIATGSDDTKAYFSNYGTLKDISAPGLSIYSTVPGNGYESWSGTSMASPVVAGVAALMRSANPSLTVAEIKNILYGTATDLGAAGKDNTFANGKVNAYNAVLQAQIGNIKYNVDATGSIPSALITGSGEYTVGSSATVQAYDFSGYRFNRWTENGMTVSTSPIYTFTVTKDISLLAEYAALTPISVSCTKTDVSLYGGASGTITAVAAGGDSGAFEYSLGDGAWNESGLFTGLPAGSYTVIARDKQYIDNACSCTVSIDQPGFMTIISAKRIPSKVNAGTAITIIPPAAPRGYATQSIFYSSGNPSVAAVDSGGNVTFLGGGKATIITKVVSQMVDKKGKIKTKTTTVKKTIIVRQPVSSISLNLGDTTIARTQKVKLLPAVAPASASNKKVKWTSSNPKVASVSSSGVVTGKAGGTAVITCSAKDGSGTLASCTVNVTPIYPTGLKLSKSALTVKLGKTAALKATIAPKKTDFKRVIWASSNPAVVGVDAKGRLKALSVGTAVITVATETGLTAVCTVTVP